MGGGHPSLPGGAEAPLPLVVDEGRVVQGMGKAGFQGPHTELALLAITEPEARPVEGAEEVERLPFYIEADPDPGGEPRVGPPRALLDPAAEGIGIPAGGEGVGLQEAGERADRGAVRERGDGGDLGRRVGGGLELPQPAGGHRGVAVQEHHVALRGGHPEVDRAHEPLALGVAEDHDSRRIMGRRLGEERLGL